MRTDPASVFPDPEPALRTAEVARVLGVSARAVRTWADEGKIACYRTFGGHRLFALSEVRRVLASWGGQGRIGSSGTVAGDLVMVVDETPMPALEASEEGATHAG